MNRVEITRALMDPTQFGLYALVYMQVCAVSDATDDEILAVCNHDNPAGTTGGWQTVVRNEEGEKAGLNPVDCDDDAGRKHFIVGC